MEHLNVPWDLFDVLFLGTTAWNSDRRPPTWHVRPEHVAFGVHCGRVNSLKRLRYAASIGCQSADGTFLAYGPDRNLPVLLGWLHTLHAPTPASTPWETTS